MRHAGTPIGTGRTSLPGHGILAVMPSAGHLLAFLTAAAIIVAIPGPSLLFTIGRALTVGRRDALLTVAGNAIGLFVQGALVAVGLGAVLAASATAYTAVKLLGAGYLVYLGVQAIHHRADLATTLGTTDTTETTDTTQTTGYAGPLTSPARALAQGLMVGLTNPKTLVFLSSLLPQFIDPTGPAGLQMLTLGTLFALLAALGDSIWAIGAGSARDWFARSPKRLGTIGATGGSLMIALGVAAAVAGRPE